MGIRLATLAAALWVEGMSSSDASEVIGVAVCFVGGLGHPCQWQAEAVGSTNEQFGPIKWGLD